MGVKSYLSILLFVNLFFTTNSIVSTTFWKSPKVCLKSILNDLLEKNREKKVLDEITVLDGTKVQRQYKFPSGMYDENAVYVGVSNHKVGGDHHYYLIAGKTRFDGYALFFKPEVHDYGRKDPMFTKGVIFELTQNPNQGQELVSNTVKAIDKIEDSRNITCLHGACAVLDEVGIDIPRFASKKFPVSAEEFSKNLLEGSVTINGKLANVKMVATSADELAHYLKKLDDGIDAETNKSMVIIMATIGAAGASVAYVAGAGVVYIVAEKLE